MQLKFFIIAIFSWSFILPSCRKKEGTDFEKESKTSLPSNDNIEDDKPAVNDNETTIEPQLTIEHKVIQNLLFLIKKNANQFAENISILNKASVNFCQGLTEDERVTLRQSWLRSMKTWQFLEAMKVGPLADKVQDIRFRIYSWPSVTNTCAIDVEVTKSENQPYQLSETFNRKGLGAVEYLSFAKKEHSCPRPPTPLMTWNLRDQIEVDKARCSYLTLVTKELTEQSKTLVDLVSNFIESKEPVSKLSQQQTQALIQEISDGLFYLDTEVKDRKLGVPAGIKGCGRNTCLTNTENRYSKSSIASIIQNLKAFRGVFGGKWFSGDRSGFYHYLEEKGAIDLAQGMLDHIDTAIANLESQEKSLLDLAKESKGVGCSKSDTEICSHFNDVKRISDDLKGEFLEILKLNAPKVAQGDAD